MSTKESLPAFLREAARVKDLVIMGRGWETVDEFRPYWHGVLPQVSSVTEH